MIFIMRFRSHWSMNVVVEVCIISILLCSVALQACKLYHFKSLLIILFASNTPALITTTTRIENVTTFLGRAKPLMEIYLLHN